MLRFSFHFRTVQCLHFDRHLVFFCLAIIPNDAPCPEVPNVVYLGTFHDLKVYFDQKFSHPKRELSDH